MEPAAFSDASSLALLTERPPSLAPAHKISVLWIRALAEVVQHHGVAPSALANDDALARDIVPGDADAYSQRAHFQDLLQRAALATRCPAIGLRLGLHASATSFGLMTPLVGHAATLRSAIALIARFQPLLLEGVTVELSETNGIACLRCELESSDELAPGFAEMIIGGLWRLLLAFGCTRDEILRVSFQHAQPAQPEEYEAAFAGAQRFGQRYTEIQLRAHALDRPNLHHNLALHNVVLTHAEQRLKQVVRPKTYTERVTDLLRVAPTAELPDMDASAKKLGISVRSLRRHLEHEGTSFRALRHARLHRAACLLLAGRGSAIQEIAHELGFSDPTAFHRAFRRWSKLTPSEYRTALARSQQNSQPSRERVDVRANALPVPELVALGSYR
jgi:AraC-like DNA-binding protein